MAFLRSRPGRAQLAALAFLVLFAIGIVALAVWYILPALQAYHQAEQMGNREGKKAISATAVLLLCVVLFILIAGLLMTFGIGRFFFPRKSAPRTRTVYPDAWEESGRRMPTPPPEDEKPDRT